MAKGSTSKLLDNIKWFAALAVFSAAVVGNSYFVSCLFISSPWGCIFIYCRSRHISRNKFWFKCNQANERIKNRNKESRLANSY